MKSKGSKKKLFAKIVLVLIIIGAIASWKAYQIVFSANIILKEEAVTYDFKIPSGASLEDITSRLESETNIKSSFNFSILANALSLDKNIHPGLYTLTNNMSNKDIILLFRSAKRKTVKLRIGFNRFASDVIKSIAPKIEATEDELLELLTNKEYISSLGFSSNTIICLFLPDTYFFNWNTSADEFFKKMQKEYVLFWNQERLDKAKIMGLTPVQVMTLASIVDQETNKNDEKSTIAGVYLNRLRIGMPLQADPTVKFALQNFELKRIRSKHTEVESLYNTYKNQGLPPGPICTASKKGIDAVLNFESHNYLYFCAKPGYTGYHQFANNFEAHKANARKYQKWLTSEGY